MLYLTLHDDPFSGQEFDETALLELVRAVARRDSDDRTLSELITFQDALERLGLLWTPFDCLPKNQCIELVRNLHLEFSTPGDMVHLKHSPAMRSYVVLTGSVLISKDMLDRQGMEGTRVLVRGDEFGIPLCPDRSPDDILSDFGEYAKTAPADHYHDNANENHAARARQGQRTDGKTELLSIRRQDWDALLQGSRAAFARMVAPDAAYKDPDPLKAAARDVFDMEAKGRNEKHIKIAVDYLVERVPFCRDLPSEQVTAMASSLELRGLTVPGRVIFRRGRECYGEAYLMFTGTADQRGGERSGDCLIKEGDIFGTEHFGAGTGDVEETKFRTATAVNRTAPCELLVLPTRERQRLQAFVAIRNSEDAMVVFETHFHNMPRETREGLSTLASFRKLTMHEVLVSAGDDVKAVFFVFRGECIARAKRQKGRSRSEQRFGPGHVVGWPYLLMDSRAAASTIPRTDVAGAAPLAANAEDPGVPGRPPRSNTAWEDTCVVATPAQVLSVPRLGLLNGLSVEALAGLRRYITVVQGATNSSEDDLEATSTSTHYQDDNAAPGRCGYEDAKEKGAHSTNGIDVSAYFGDGFQHSRRRSRRRVHHACAGARLVTAPETALPALGMARARRPRTAHVTLARWRWREKLEDGTPHITSSSTVTRTPTSTVAAAVWGIARSGVRQTRKNSGWCCPLDGCLGRSASQRLQRFHQTPPWTSVRCTRANRGTTCSSRSDRHSTEVRGTAAHARGKDGQKLLEGQSHEIAQQGDLERTVIPGGKGDSSGSVGSASRSDGSISIQGSLGPQSPRLATVNLSSGGASAGPKFHHGHPGGPKPSVGVVTGLRQTGMAAIVQAERRAEQRIYTLVQLSRRSGLDPSEPLAAMCLRLLGSFETEAEVTALIFNLYYIVLPQKPAWRPFHRMDKHTLAGLETASDIVFLLRKGAPVQSLRFDVSANSLSTSSSGDERRAHNDVDIGRGYDRRYPSVFKAKEQYFAVALPPSADRVAQEWQKQRDRCSRRLLQKQAVQEADKKAVAMPSSEVGRGGNSGINQGQGGRQSSFVGEGRAIAHQDGKSHERQAAEDASEATAFDANKIKIEPTDTAAGNLADAVRVDPRGVEHRVSGISDDHDDAGIISTTTSRELSAGTDRKGRDGRGIVDVTGMATNSADECDCDRGGGVYASANNVGKGQGYYEGQHSGVGAIGPTSGADKCTAEDTGTTNFTPCDSDLLFTHDIEDDTTAEWNRSGGQGGLSAASAAGFIGENPVHGGDDERNERISWILNRMALLDKVEGCYETEAMAFKKAIRIVDGMEAGNIGDAIITPPSSKPASPSAQHRVHRSEKSSRACVFPLYQWLSLGDGGIDGFEGTIRKYTVADPPEAIGKGLDTTALWMEQRANSLRSNLYNMLRAAGPREIRSRCSARVSCAPASSALVTGAERRDHGEGGHDEEIVSAVGVVREGRSNRGDHYSGKRDIEMVQAARDAVLRQNQKLIQTEVKVRNRILARLSTAPGAETHPQDGGGSMPHCAFTSTSEAAAGTITHNDKLPYGFPDDASTTSIDVRREEGGAESGIGSRHQLRLQMSIERKRARLFEDIQMLPYSRVKSGRQVSGDRKRTATVPRPKIVRSQTRLHGRPTSSFFAKTRTVPVASPVAPFSTAPAAVESGECGDDLGVCNSSLELPPAEIPVTGLGDTKVGFHSSSKVALDAGDTPRAACVASKADSASPSLEEEVHSIESGSSVLGDGASIGCGESVPTVTTEISTPKFTVVAAINSRRVVSTAFGGRGRHAVRKGGNNPCHIRATPCSLDGELMLLDGVLHDPHVRAWVENSLGSSIICKR